MAHKTQKTNHRNNTKKRLSLIKLWGVLLFGFVLLAALFIGYSYRHEHRERGQLGISDIYLSDKLSHSLDLKLAAKASYPSQPLSIVKDLGLKNGSLHQQIFSFDVEADGLTEYGLLTTPTGPVPKTGWPTLILLHGYSNPARYNTLTGYIPDVDFYAQHGFAVVKPDYRGQGLSVNQGQPDSPYYSMAYNTDVMSLINALKQTNFINSKDINLWGHSMGAYVALRVAVLNPDIKNVILLSGPVDSLKEMYLSYVPPSEANNPYALATQNDVFSKYHPPDYDSQFWYDASPSNFLSQIKANVQIHVGQKDSVVPPKFSADLNQGLTKANVKHEYYSYSDGNHSLVNQKGLIWQRSLQVLNNT